MNPIVTTFAMVSALALASGTAATQTPAPQTPAPQTPAPSTQDNALKLAVTETSVRHAYDAAKWQPIWQAADRATLTQILAQRQRHGLDQLSFLPTDAESGTPEAVDVAFTRAALKYAAALSQGVTDPAALHAIYTLPRPSVDLGAGLVAAINGGTLAQWVDGLAPGDAEYRALSDAYVATRARIGNGTPTIASRASIHVGDNDPRVAAIAARLVDGGYLASPPAKTAAGRYSAAIAEAVRKLQRDYGIGDDGIVGPDTMHVLNIDPADRARTLAVGLERRRWLSRTPPATRIDVNTAAAQLAYIRDGQVVDERKVIAGKPGRETPSLASPIYRLVANPTWTIPKSIQNTELAHVGGAYLRSHHMKMQNGWIVQQPGPHNALGLVKFDMRNEHAIYLHDTSAPALFDRSERHLSHGCVRVFDAIGFATMLADDQGVGDAWRKAHESGDYTIVALPHQIPVRLLYHNVFVGRDGAIAYRTDPYGWNDAVAAKLGFGEGGGKRAQAGSVDIGP